MPVDYCKNIFYKLIIIFILLTNKVNAEPFAVKKTIANIDDLNFIVPTKYNIFELCKIMENYLYNYNESCKSIMLLNFTILDKQITESNIITEITFNNKFTLYDNINLEIGTNLSLYNSNQLMKMPIFEPSIYAKINVLSKQKLIGFENSIVFSKFGYAEEHGTLGGIKSYLWYNLFSSLWDPIFKINVGLLSDWQNFLFAYNYYANQDYKNSEVKSIYLYENFDFAFSPVLTIFYLTYMNINNLFYINSNINYKIILDSFYNECNINQNNTCNAVLHKYNNKANLSLKLGIVNKNNFAYNITLLYGGLNVLDSMYITRQTWITTYKYGLTIDFYIIK